MSKIKWKLVDAGILQQVPGTEFFERGPNAKFFEEAMKIEKEVVERRMVEGAKAQPSNRPAVEDRAVNSFVPQPSIEVRDYDIPGLDAHMHGSLIYEIETMGDLKKAIIRQPGKDDLEVPLFTGNDDLNYHNNHRWECKLRLPGREKEISIQLRITPEVKQLTIYPTRTIITEAEYLKSKTTPGDYFVGEAMSVLNFLEKYAGWRFKRVNGSRDGRLVGGVYYALSDPSLTKLIPPNLRGFEDSPGLHIDGSLGRPELEANRDKVENLWALTHAKEIFDRQDASIHDLAAGLEEQERKNQTLELELSRVRGENLKLFLELEEEQNRCLKLLYRERKLKLHEKTQELITGADRTRTMDTVEGAMFQ